MDRHVWIQPDDGQPAWAVGGTFQAIRVIRMMVEFWDRTRLNEQEALIGRHRDSGAPLGAERGDRRAGVRRRPRRRTSPAPTRARPGSERNLILRRPFSYVGGVDENSQLDQGLIFTCYQRSLDDGFMTVQTRLDGEALEEYIRPLGGGFFVVPPGPGSGDDGYLGQSLLDLIGLHPAGGHRVSAPTMTMTMSGDSAHVAPYRPSPALAQIEWTALRWIADLFGQPAPARVACSPPVEPTPTSPRW